MPRVSREIKALGEAHRATMEKQPSFPVWARRHLKCKDRVEDYEKAYNYIQKGQDDDETPAEL